MKTFHYLFIIILIVVAVLVIILNPGNRGVGLKGIIEPGGRGPTWVSAGAGRIFVSNTLSSNIAVYSIASGDYIGSIDDIPNPGFSYFSEEANKLFIAVGGEGEGSLLVIDPEVLNALNEIRLERECRGMVTSSSGKLLYSIWGGLKEGAGLFTRTKMKDYSIVGFGSTRESPTSILLSPDGKKAYITSHFGQRSLASWLGEYEGVPGIRSVVEVFSLVGETEMTLIDEIEVGLKPQSMAAFGDGRYIIVAAAAFENEDMGLPNFSIIDTETDEVIEEIHTPGYAPFIVVADDELGMAFSTYLHKVPALDDETEDVEKQDTEMVTEGLISGGDTELEDGEVKYIPVYGKGFLAINLEDFTVDIYTDERGLPLASLCILDDHRLIGVSPGANKLAVIEPVL